MIRLLETLRLVRDVKLPPAAVLEEGRLGMVGQRGAAEDAGDLGRG